MLTLLGSLLGFVSSTVPEGIKVLQERADRKHELAILDRQLEVQKQGHTQRLEEIQVGADIAEAMTLYEHDKRSSGVLWIEGLRASVRPLLTYAFFGLFAVVKISALGVLIKNGMGVQEALIAVWDGETQALFAAVISFWFGGRALSKLRSRI